MLKRIIALFLCMVMVLTMLPMQAFATEVETEVTEQTVATDAAEETTVVTEAPTETTEATETMEEMIAYSEAVTEPVEETTLPTEETVPEETVVEVEKIISSDAMGVAIVASGECGGTDESPVSWSLVNGVLTISGIGEITESPWYDYRSQITRVVIPYGVSDPYGWYINFYQYPELTSAFIGMEHATGCFRDCDKLTDVTIGADVVSIGLKNSGYFSENDSLTEVMIPDNVKYIDEFAFANCSTLTSVTLPKGLTEISTFLFHNCPKLASIVIPENVTTICSNAFSSCQGLTTVSLPEGLKCIEDSAFAGCRSLTDIALPSTLETIGDYAFQGCPSLERITIPASVTSIGVYAFNASLGWFDDWKLQAINVSEENRQYSSDSSGVLFNKDKTTLIQATNLLSGKYTVPDTVRTIEARAFAHCDYLTEVVLPDTITDIGEYAFYGCRRLRQVNIPGSLTVLSSSVFSDCPLQEIVIPEGVVKIGQEAFCQDYIIDDPGIEPTATELIIPASVREIGPNAFNGYESLQEITFLGDAPMVTLEYDWDYPPFGYLQSVLYYDPEKADWTEENMLALAGEFGRWLPISMKGGIDIDLPETQIYTDRLVCGTVYTANGDNSMEPQITLTPSDMHYYVSMDILLPEGFSFEKNSIVSEKHIEVAEVLDQEIQKRLPTIYPIYIDEANQMEEYSLTLILSALNHSGEWITSIEQKVFYRPSQTDNIAKPACPNIETVEEYTFSLSSAMGSGTTYNKETARLCAMMADMAYDRIAMEQFLVEELGFSDFERQGIHLNNDLLHLMGRYYASKKIIVNGQVKNLVYVICRGTGGVPFFGREWSSNFDTGLGNVHTGFDGAASRVQTELKDYCNNPEFTQDNTIIVVTGHSRGAAAANLVGHWLNTEAGLSHKENTCIYTFATPTVDKGVISEEAGYTGNENIFNWVNYQDVIRNCASMQYYGRYGSTRIFAFETGKAGETYHFDGYGAYPLPNNGANYTLNELFNSVLYSCDTSSPLSVAKGVFDLAKFTKMRIALFDSGLSEIISAHLMPIYYLAVVKDGDSASFEEVNQRTEEVYRDFMNLELPKEEHVVQYTFKCPVNLYVYNSNNELVASIINKQITCDDENLLIYINGDSLNIGLFEDEWDNYSIKIEGYDDGTMKHCIQTIDVDGVESIQLREDIPITEGGILEVNIDGLVAIPGETAVDAQAAYTTYVEESELEDVLNSLSHTHEFGDWNQILDPTCDADGQETSTCQCGHVEYRSIPATGVHSYVNGFCEHCGVEKEHAMIDFYAANVIMGNNLDMMFALRKTAVSDWTGHYIQLERTYADGRAAHIQKIPYAQWDTNGSFYVVTYKGLAAKEMCDTITLTVYNADNRVISNPWVDSMRGYAMRQLTKCTDLQKTMFVDMLNYGAQAQSYFGYGTEDLANSQLTEEQKAYASGAKTLVSTLDQGDKWKASNLILKSNIQFMVAFNGLTDDMSARVQFTGHKGNVVDRTVAGTEFGNNNGIRYVLIDDLVIADARQEITITIYNADGSVYTVCQESIQDYLARRSSVSSLFEAIMKFADSAYAYLHRNA